MATPLVNTKALPWLLGALALALALGCSSESPASGCDFVERPVGFDEVFGNRTLGEIRDEMVRPRAGEVVWLGGGGLLALDPATGSTPFTLTVQLDDDPIIVEPDATAGGDRASCNAEVKFDTVLELESEDGALMERWETEGTVYVDAIPGLEVQMSDPVVAGGLTWSVPVELSADYDEAHLSLYLFAPPDTEPPTAHGELTYVFERAGDGEAEILRLPIASFQH